MANTKTTDLALSPLGANIIFKKLGYLHIDHAYEINTLSTQEKHNYS